MSNAVILVADENYVPHAKHMMVNLRREGQWDGDIAVITGEDANLSEFSTRCIPTLKTSGKGFLTKFYLFNVFLQQWDAVVYLDCDIIVNGPIQKLFDQLEAAELLNDGKKPIIAGKEDIPAKIVFERHAEAAPGGKELLAQLELEFPWVNEPFWNTSTMVFRPDSIHLDTFQQLQSLQERFKEINHPDRQGTDQEIIHLALFHRMIQVKEKLFCYWGLDEYNARGPSASRGWAGNETPVLIHYCRWYAPWIEKKQDMDAYFNHRLKRPCHEIYKENLAAFDSMFPRR